MKKRKYTLLIVIMLLAGLFISALTVMAAAQKIYDEAELFSASEKGSLEKQTVSLSERINMDVIIITTNENDGKTSSAYADDFYDMNGFGYGDEADGVLLLINMEDREVYISTCGKAIHYLTDRRIENMLDKIYPHLSEGNYSEGAAAFLNSLEYYVKEGIPANQVTKDESFTGNPSDPSYTVYRETENPSKKALICLVISLGIGAGVVGVMAAHNKGRIGTNANTYLDPRSFKLLHAEDRHVNTKITHVTINTNSGGSGTSSTHTSSGGASHGGGGRKF